jgi:hypothetical protein
MRGEHLCFLRQEFNIWQAGQMDGRTPLLTPHTSLMRYAVLTFFVASAVWLAVCCTVR